MFPNATKSFGVPVGKWQRGYFAENGGEGILHRRTELPRRPGSARAEALLYALLSGENRDAGLSPVRGLRVQTVDPHTVGANPTAE